jgi:hypothetical protein
MHRRAPEGPRDELETAFTPILRRVWTEVSTVLSVAFVDHEGECIDYVSSLDAFEAKVSAAHATMLIEQLRSRQQKLGLSVPVMLMIGATRRELWARRVTEEHLLVAISAHGAEAAGIAPVLERAAAEFRREVAAALPPWEASPPLEVVLRAAVGWPYAPAAFTEEGVRVVVTDVLGRWTEHPDEPGIEERTCFRVRTDDGRELTLVHDPARPGWLVRT